MVMCIYIYILKFKLIFTNSFMLQLLFHNLSNWLAGLFERKHVLLCINNNENYKIQFSSIYIYIYQQHKVFSKYVQHIPMYCMSAASSRTPSGN